MIQDKMREELKSRRLFEQARDYAFEYMDGVEKMDVFPSKSSIEAMNVFSESMPGQPSTAEDVLSLLHTYGSPGTIAQTAGRYFGFVNGGAVPASLGAKWLSDVWDQCAGLYLTSPINAKLESVCEQWLKEIFRLPESTVAGFVSGTSMANLCGLVAARYHLLNQLGWDVNTDGLNGAPHLRILAHRQVHASVKKTLSMLGYGINSIEWLPADDQGRLIAEELPALDNSCMVLLQAGNVNTGAYDDFDEVCDRAAKAGAWVHIDGAFGLWAGACKSLAHLTKGMEKANSWAVDGHKTLNTPYDSGIVLCKHPEALITALQASGEYILYSEQRDPLLYTPELSKRARAVELWATLKYLGASGIDEMITTFHGRAKQLEKGLRELGLTILNDVVFNQVLVAGDNDEETKNMVEFIQGSGRAWLGGTTWQGKAAIRISICSWATTKEDIDVLLELFADGLKINSHIDSNNH